MSKNRFNLDEEQPEEQREEQHEEGQEDEGLGSRKDDEETYASPEQFEKDKGNLIDFLQYPRDKRRLTDFLEDTYKKYEEESVERTINRAKHEHESEQQGATPWHKPGHIGSLMYEYLNMI